MHRTYLYGGVGNQLFQYFLLYGHTENFEVSEIFLNNYTTHSSNIKQLLRINEASEHYNKISFISDNLRKLLIRGFCAFGMAQIIGIKTDGSADLFTNTNQHYFGYWHDLNLFEPHRKKILEANWLHDLRFLEMHSRSEILSDDAFVLHIRKGDYTIKKNTKIFADLDVKFYIDALNQLGLPIGKLIICTDDQDWVRKYLSPELSIFCNNIDMSSSYGCKTWVDDFLLMRFSKNLIMSNSTFSWWAAFLSDNNVYCPRRWYKSLQFTMKRDAWNWFGTIQ